MINFILMGQFSDFVNLHFPYLGMKLINIPLAKRRWRGSLEENVVVGKTSLKNQNSKKSIVFFSVHKAGSSIALKFLQKFALSKDLISLNYDAYIGSVHPEKSILYEDINFLNRAFPDQGFFFGCLRRYFKLQNAENYNIILLIRDPRDVLVSYYYSMKYTNRIHHKRGVDARKRSNQLSIDEFVLELVPRFKKLYEDYLDNFFGKDYVLITKYEDMISDSTNWLSEIAKFTGHELPLGLSREIKGEINNLEVIENTNTHKRKGGSGDYLNKLSKRTVKILNDEFEIILQRFNYIRS